MREAFTEVLGASGIWSNLAQQETSLVLLEPLDYLPFVYMMSKAFLILTDSGGIQEEAPYLGKAVLVARTTTERPEALEAGNSQLLELVAPKIIEKVTALIENEPLHQSMAQVRQVFGDGLASHKILDTIARSV